MEQLHLLPGHTGLDRSGARRPRERHIIGEPESDAVYFARRASEERAFALRQEIELTKALHLDISERYASLAAAIGEIDEKLG